MSRQNQTNLFLNLDDYLGILLSDVKDKINHDHYEYVRIIVGHHATKLLIEVPDIRSEIFYSAVKSLFDFLVDYKLFEEVFRLNLYENKTIPIVLTINKREKIIFLIKRLSYYLQNELDETTEDRERRIDNYIDEFVLNFPTGNLSLREPKYIVQSTFVQYLKRLTSSSYFLSNQDLDKFIEWMCEAYNRQIGPFSEKQLVSDQYYPIQLVTRKVILKLIENFNSPK